MRSGLCFCAGYAFTRELLRNLGLRDTDILTSASLNEEGIQVTAGF
jgi:hypothetical protein